MGVFDERRYTKEGVRKIIADIEWEEAQKAVEKHSLNFTKNKRNKH